MFTAHLRICGQRQQDSTADISLGKAPVHVVVPSIAEKLSSYPSVHFDWMDAGHLLPLEAPTTAQWVTAQLQGSVVS